MANASLSDFPVVVNLIIGIYINIQFLAPNVKINFRFYESIIDV